MLPPIRAVTLDDEFEKLMSKSYRWTRWVAPGGGGYFLGVLLSYVVGIGAAVWMFFIIPHWWWAILAAPFGYFLGTCVAGVIWGTIRRLVERMEGI
jgi:hypothetical protein